MAFFDTNKEGENKKESDPEHQIINCFVCSNRWPKELMYKPEEYFFLHPFPHHFPAGSYLCKRCIETANEVLYEKWEKEKSKLEKEIKQVDEKLKQEEEKEIARSLRRKNYAIVVCGLCLIVEELSKKIK